MKPVSVNPSSQELPCSVAGKCWPCQAMSHLAWRHACISEVKQSRREGNKLNAEEFICNYNEEAHGFAKVALHKPQQTSVQKAPISISTTGVISLSTDVSLGQAQQPQKPYSQLQPPPSNP